MKNPTPSEPRKFDSLAQCSAATGIPLLVLKRAKRAGCPAFHNSRVSLLPFIRWHFAQDATILDLPALQAEQVRLQNEKLAAQTAILKKLWCPKADVFKWGAMLGHAIRRVVESLHLQAPNLAGLDVAAISSALKASEVEIMGQLNTLSTATSTWSEQAEAESADTIISEQAKPARQAAMKQILNPDPKP